MSRLGCCLTLLAIFSHGKAFVQHATVRGRQKNSHQCHVTSTSTTTVTKTETPLPTIAQEEECVYDTSVVGAVPVVLAAREPLCSMVSDPDTEFSVLCWNILLPNSMDNWWNHKLYDSSVPREYTQWPHRQALIRERLRQANADIVCIQEASGDSFAQDFDFMIQEAAGYDYCLHNKFRFRCATFYKRDKFTLQQAAHKDRTLVTTLQCQANKQRLLHVVNCHLSGGAAPDRRLRQVHDALEQIRKWNDRAAQTLIKQQQSNRPNPHNIDKAAKEWALYQSAGILLCGDFNSDGNTAVRRLLVHGSVDPDWREPQYPTVRLTSQTRRHEYKFWDAAELAYGANVCDGDYGQAAADMKNGCRPATYVVPNYASLLLLPPSPPPCQPQGSHHLRTEFGFQVAKGVAKGIATTLQLNKFTQEEIDAAFDQIDLNGNGVIDQYELQQLVETVYHNTHGEASTEQDRQAFFAGFQAIMATSCNNDKHTGELSRQQVRDRLLALQQQLQGGTQGSELVEIQTDHDAQQMVNRFTPVLKEALDFVFDKFSSDGETLTEAEVEAFLLATNGQVGRGGMWRHIQAMLEDAADQTCPRLNRHQWYMAFARELGEGKWWQCVHDLEVCGANISSQLWENSNSQQRHYQAWLDYLYFDSGTLSCKCIQEGLTQTEFSLLYEKGEALPNAWHPSDHLPVAGVFSWK